MRFGLKQAGTLVGCVMLLAARSGFGQTTRPAPEKVHDFTRFEKDIAAFEAADRENPPPKGAWLFTGSSTIRIWKSLAADFPDNKVINRGFDGSFIIDATHFADRMIFPYEPSLVVIRSGTNDLWAGRSFTQVFSDFKEFVTKVHARLPQTPIVFISLSPSIARWEQAEQEQSLNIMIKQSGRTMPYVKFIEAFDVPLGSDAKPRPELFGEDKLHFNAEGYKLLAQRVGPLMPK